MLFEHIDILDENFEHHRNRFVAVRGDKIAYVGETRPEGDFGEVYDGRGKLLCPAFVNSHGHTPMVALRGYGENMALDDWLNKRIFPFEAHWTAERIRPATLWGIAEMLQGGTASVSDMYMHCPTMAEAFLESGMKVNLNSAVVCFDEREFRDTKEYAETELLFAEHADADGRVKIDVGIHAEYTNTERIVRGAAAYAAEKKANIHLHLSETKKEHAECLTRHGKTPAAFFADCGVFQNPTTAAHCVYADDNDLALFSQYGVTVAANPTSNLKLASGVAPLQKMLDRNINLAIGTDSAASNNNLDMVEEMKFFALVSKGFSGDPTVVTPKEALRAATRGGAIGQGRWNCGVIAEGFKADLAVFDLQNPALQPLHDAATQLVYAACGRDVCLTMVDGRVLYQNGEFLTIDIERCRFELNRVKDEILAELAR